MPLVGVEEAHCPTQNSIPCFDLSTVFGSLNAVKPGHWNGSMCEKHRVFFVTGAGNNVRDARNDNTAGRVVSG